MGEKLTKSDVAKIEEEINYRKLVVRKNAIEAVKEARAQGDLSENFEYYAAKKDKNQNESRIRYLERMLKNAQIVSDESKDDEVGINNTVELYMEDDDEVETYRLVTSIRGNSLEGLISIESPLGKAIFKHKAGDRVYVKVIDYKTGNTSFDPFYPEHPGDTGGPYSQLLKSLLKILQRCAGNGSQKLRCPLIPHRSSGSAPLQEVLPVNKAGLIPGRWAHSPDSSGI